jgi:hypothetical protein
MILKNSGAFQLQVRIGGLLQATYWVRAGSTVGELYGQLSLDIRTHVTHAGGKSGIESHRPIAQSWKWLEIDPSGRGGADNPPRSKNKPNIQGSPGHALDMSSQPTSALDTINMTWKLFDEAFWPHIFASLDGTQYDEDYFSNCAFSEDTMSNIRNCISTDVVHLLDDIKGTILRSLADQASPLSHLAVLYDRQAPCSSVQTDEMKAFAELNFGRLLNHDLVDEDQQSEWSDDEANLTNDTIPTYARAVVISSIARGMLLDALIAELMIALAGWPIHWRRFTVSLQASEFLGTQLFGNQFSVLAPLTASFPFYSHPVEDQLPLAGVAYGNRYAVPGGSGKTYAMRFSVQVSPTSNISDLACAKTIATVAWGSEGPLSEILQHNLLLGYLEFHLAEEDKKRLILVTSRAAVPTQGGPTTRMAVSVLYVFKARSIPCEDQLRLNNILFKGLAHVTIHGVTLAVFKLPTEALTKRPNCKSLAPCNILTISGLNLHTPVSEVIDVLLKAGAINFRTLVNVFTALNKNAKDKLLRYILILGNAVVGHISLEDKVLGPISTRSVHMYDIRMEVGELLAQAKLRAAHQSKQTTPVRPAPPPSIVSRRANNAPAWTSTPSTLERYTPPENTVTTNQAQSSILANHSVQIDKINATLLDLGQKIDSHAQIIKDVATRSELENMFKQYMTPRA